MIHTFFFQTMVYELGHIIYILISKNSCTTHVYLLLVYYFSEN